MTQEQFEILIEMFSWMVGLGVSCLAVALVGWCVIEWWFEET